MREFLEPLNLLERREALSALQNIVKLLEDSGMDTSKWRKAIELWQDSEAFSPLTYVPIEPLSRPHTDDMRGMVETLDAQLGTSQKIGEALKTREEWYLNLINKEKLPQNRIGSYNKYLQMAEAQWEEEKVCEVRNHPARFKITAGPWQVEDKVYEETFILEIHYDDIGPRFRGFFGSFGSHLYADFAEKAHELALEFCKRQGWIISHHLNSWPEFQAVVSKPRPDHMKRIIEASGTKEDEKQAA